MIIDRLQTFEGLFRVFAGIDRGDFRAATPNIAAIKTFDLGFLNIAGIRQHVGQKIAGGFGRVDRPVKTGLHQFGKQPGMINMRMGQKHATNIRSLERKSSIVQFANRLAALKHAAIDNDITTVGTQQITRTGNATRSPAKSN